MVCDQAHIFGSVEGNELRRVCGQVHIFGLSRETSSRVVRDQIHFSVLMKKRALDWFVIRWLWSLSCREGGALFAVHLEFC